MLGPILYSEPILSAVMLTSRCPGINPALVTCADGTTIVLSALNINPEGGVSLVLAIITCAVLFKLKIVTNPLAF